MTDIVETVARDRETLIRKMAEACPWWQNLDDHGREDLLVSMQCALNVIEKSGEEDGDRLAAMQSFGSLCGASGEEAMDGEWELNGTMIVNLILGGIRFRHAMVEAGRLRT